MHLPEVGGELGLLVVAAGHIGMGADHLAPGGQAAGRGGADGGGGAAALAAGLFLKTQAQQLILQSLDVACLLRGDRHQQAVGGVEHAVGIVTGERLLVRPAVAEVAQFAD